MTEQIEGVNVRDQRPGPWLNLLCCARSPRGVQRMADLLGVSRQTVYRWRRANQIPIYRVRELVALIEAGALVEARK